MQTDSPLVLNNKIRNGFGLSEIFGAGFD